LPKRRPRKLTARLYPCVVAPETAGMRFAERVFHGVGDDGSREEIVIWIERRPGARWAVGRAIDPRNRSNPAPRSDDYIFEGYELTDALEAANNALSDDLEVSAGEGVNEDVRPFEDDELLKPLERWFFGHRPD
jgi:hypothetical protein